MRIGMLFMGRCICGAGGIGLSVALRATDLPINLTMTMFSGAPGVELRLAAERQGIGVAP